MHKSKLYDMAGEIAMDKLVPKPIHIAISMQGGGGISSLNENIVYRQGAGRIVTDTWNRIPNFVKQYGKGVVNKALYETTGKTLSDTTREDMTKAEAAALEEAMAEAVVTGKGEFGDIGTSFEDWIDLGEKGNVSRDAEAIVGGATVNWNPKSGQYEINDPYDFPKYSIPGMFYNEVNSINDWLEKRGNTRDQIVDPTGGLGGALLGRMFPDNRAFGIGLGLGSRLVGESKNERYFDEKDRKHKIRHIPYAGAFKTSMGISPQKLQDISEKHDFFGVKDQSLKRTGEGFGGGAEFGLVGGEASGGYSYDPQTDTTFIDEVPIDTTAAFKHGGQTMPRGLSGINDSININGQPHRLVWANPKEEKVLKDMGGSGKKVLGKPAYFDEWSFAETVEDLHGPSPTTQSYTEPSEYEYLTSEESYPDEPAMTYPSRIDTLEREVARTEAQPHLGTGHLGVNSEMIRDLMARDNASYDQVISRLSGTQPSLRMIGARQVEGLPWLADKNIPAARQSYNLVGDLPKKGFLGLTGDPMNMSEAIEGAYKSGFAKWRAGIGMYEADAPKAYNEWFAKQNPEDLVEGYKYGDPVGHSTRSAMNRVTKQLKNKFTAARDLASVGQEDEEPYKMTRKDYQEVANEIKDIEDFTPYDGILPAWMPGWMKAGAGFFSRTVIGTGKVGGVPVHIHEDGTVTAISPEDSPGYDHELHHEPGGEVARRYRPRPVEQASISETIEEEPTGIAKVLASRSKPSTLAQLNEEMQERVNRLYNRNIFT